MGFYIKMLDEYDREERASYGIISIEDYSERFLASLQYWTLQEYEQHWQRAIVHILTGAEKSCLITSMLDPKIANYIFWWPIYRNGDIIYIQNHLLLMDQIKTAFDEKNPYMCIPDRAVLSEEGQKISEWKTNISSLEEFLRGISD
jgi:hypothetical protein